MGFVLTAIRQEGKDTLAKTLGIDGKIQAIMALGIPAFKYPEVHGPERDRQELYRVRLDGDNLVDRGMRSIGLRIVSQWITIRKSLTYGSNLIGLPG